MVREWRNGTYRLVSYYLAITAAWVTYYLILVVMWIVILYAVVGMTPGDGFNRMLRMSLLLFTLAVTGIELGLLLGTQLSSVQMAVTIVPLVMMPQMVLQARQGRVCSCACVCSCVCVCVCDVM